MTSSAGLEADLRSALPHRHIMARLAVDLRGRGFDISEDRRSR